MGGIGTANIVGVSALQAINNVGGNYVSNDYTEQQKEAILDYVSADAIYGGYSFSQNMNYKIEQGVALSEYENKVVSNLNSAMAPLGKDVTLYRAAHNTFIKQMDIGNYETMTPTQLNKALKGIIYKENKFVSTSLNMEDNHFIKAGSRAVYIKINAPSNTKAFAGRSDQKEIVLEKGTQFKIKSAKFTGETAHPLKGKPAKRIVIEVDIV